MRRNLLPILIGALMTDGSSLAMAQSDSPSGQSKLQQRALLRHELRQAGFQNIRILDAMFFVEARTGDGQHVYMLVNPPGSGADSVGLNRRQSGPDSDRSYGFNTPTRYGSPYYTPPDAIPQFNTGAVERRQ
jgi:hypothetical protein